MTEPKGSEIAAAAPAGWAYLIDGLQTRVRTPDFQAGLALVAAIGAAAMAELALFPSHVDIRLTGDFGLAHTITDIVTAAGYAPECEDVARIEIALDTPARAGVMPFWSAVLGLQQVGPNDIQDPDGVLPCLWFQTSGDEEPRQRWHPDLWVDPAQVQPRIDAAVAAGGKLVDTSEAPSFWVLQDPEGNKVCLCTWQNRDDD
jgi:4a-hydroxytetrahydrobiopterin dehydratase